MYISKLSLVNYRNFSNTFFKFKKGINTLIGENGSGKTNAFRAMRLLLDANLLQYSYRLNEDDFNRSIGNWKGHWIIISIEFNDVSDDEAIQSLFLHGTGNIAENKIEKATYNLFFRPKADIRKKLSELDEGDIEGLNNILDAISIEDYETFFTGKSEADFNDPEVYKDLVGDFENVKFQFELDASKYGIKIPHQLSVSKEVAFTFIKALRDVVSDFQNNRTNPLISLLKSQSTEIDETEYAPISDTVRVLNESIENLSDVQSIRKNIESTIKETVGETYSPSSISIKSNLSDEANKLLQSLRLFIGEPDETYEGGVHELSLGGANLIFLTLKLLEYKYLKSKQPFANFLLIEEPEAHIHTHIQRTLFDKLDFGDTQIIYSTHSTHISEVSNLENINILSKKINYAEVYQPSTGLSASEIIKLERFLDAVRTNLLFAKGVILIEGDAEEIAIPILIKRVFGVSLDELGISLINIRSTGFENIAQIFNDERLRRRCSILTDSDKAIISTQIEDGDSDKLKARKVKVANSESKGIARKKRLDEFTKENQWLSVFYAENTFEVDFVKAGNEWEVEQLIEEIYTDPETIEKSKNEIQSGELSKFGTRVLRMANNIGKGWFSVLLGNHININTEIPSYIIEAIVFAKRTFTMQLIYDIVQYRLQMLFENKDLEISEAEIDTILTDFKRDEDLGQLIQTLNGTISNDQLISFLTKI